ncbi:MAG: MBL fold metallo-hydrolase [Flavitalea sp.]
MKKKEDSTHFIKGAFRNISDTPVMAKGVSYTKVIRDSLNRPKNVKPPNILPSVKTDLKSIVSDEPFIVWFGHSSYFIQVNNIRILVDPVFSGHASPVSFMVKSFPGSDIYTVDDLPEIDMLIITHNHYDHLDSKTLELLKKKVKNIYTPLAVGPDIKMKELWQKTFELDWWDSIKVTADIELIATPARHFSGRGIKRGESLWASFVLKIYEYSIFIGGDSGYDDHFREIGKWQGPFDIAILECGQYNKNWPYIHMMPEETVTAAQDLGAKWLMPVHWSKFALALHPWNEPIKRVTKKAKEVNMKITTPMIGEPVILNKCYPAKEWWNI